MKNTFPEGKRVALSITPDFDAHSAWMAGYGGGRTDPAALSRGEFGARVGVPRLLDLLREYDIKGTWGIPGHSMLTWPELTQAIVNDGHEVCAHGHCHENLGQLSEMVERKILEDQLQAYSDVIGGRPRGYRVPSATMTHNTFRLLEEHEFEWSSSISGDDLTPYRPQEIIRLSPHQGNKFGREYAIVEYPISWYVEDWAAFEYSSGHSQGLSDTDVVLRRWVDTLDYAIDRMPEAVMTLVLHPESVGRAHHMLMLEKFLKYAASREEVWIAPLSEIHDNWKM